MFMLILSTQFDYSRQQQWTTVKLEDLDSKVRNYITDTIDGGIGSDGKVTITKIRLTTALGLRYRVEFKFDSQYLKKVGILKIWVKDNNEIVNEGMHFGKD
ncbi:Hypothetical_protein [Hexamita inflata]|uniref:Hypothetical_protein n=1 Tax=Hexamita inflata TaxID=28002 RepID=A0AA86UCD6_9EUKA|nr:Hypothetical protein HINF_LOCUS37754 [Hexamita inflata]